MTNINYLYWGGDSIYRLKLKDSIVEIAGTVKVPNAIIKLKRGTFKVAGRDVVLRMRPTNIPDVRFLCVYIF